MLRLVDEHKSDNKYSLSFLTTFEELTHILNFLSFSSWQ